MCNDSRDINNPCFESSASKIFEVFLFAVKALYFAGTTSPSSRFRFPSVSSHSLEGCDGCKDEANTETENTGNFHTRKLVKLWYIFIGK